MGPYEYETRVQWTEARRGALAAESRPTIATGAPPEFAGSDDVWSPEHLLVGAVNSCVMLTLLAVAANSKIELRSYGAAATGILEKVEGRGPVITRVVVRPRIGIAADVARDKVERLVKMAERNCFISNSIHAQVSIEAEIVVE